MTTIHICDAAGTKHALEMTDGLSVMEVTRDLDIGIGGECEGSLACATCHVWVDQDWMERVGEPSDAEADMLDCAFNTRQTSRLSCQIRVSSAIDGLLLTVPS